ncbi:MAG: hypothetical protein CMD74_01990 [Gammaproteobacteria bacterium]|nr:hypothetical protein [Gammaproteobacteria bacterium]|tara:strand:+ start:70 stop:555 length:486 start_codon:yes stop_codon:yes gene_type:complete
MDEIILEQLRDIHYPPDPDWWPLALGWWLLVSLTIFITVLTTYKIRKNIENSRPYTIADELLNELYTKLKHEEIEGTEYANRANEIIKRLLVHIKKDPRAVPASGESWLQILDDLSNTKEFTLGAGRILGSQRFSNQLSGNTAAIHSLLSNLVNRLKIQND